MKNGAETKNLQWYVIRTKLKQEERADSNLRSCVEETFAPRIKELRHNRFTGQQTYTVKPLFPSYIFARFDLSSLTRKVLFTRGVHSIVSFGGCPAHVDEGIIEMIKSRMKNDGFVRLGDEFSFGDEVMIKDGPLKSVSGIFQREAKGPERAMILLRTVSYQAHIEIDNGMLMKL